MVRVNQAGPGIVVRIDPLGAHYERLTDLVVRSEAGRIGISPVPPVVGTARKPKE